MIPLISTVLDLAGSILALWVHEKKDKYNSQYLELKRRFWDEANKPESEQDFAVLDNLQAEIQQFGQALNNQIALNK